MQGLKTVIFQQSYKILRFLWFFYQVVLGICFFSLLALVLWVAHELKIFEIYKLRSQPPLTTPFMEQVRKQGLNPQYEWISLNKIPNRWLDIILVAEDAKFFMHQGFDLEEIQYSIVANYQRGRAFRGASTISQQVAKNLFLSPEKTLIRKAKEALYTLQLEHLLGKRRILELYINIAQTGPEQFGVAQGAKYHFKKPVHKLSDEQWLSLISVFPSPKKWSPKKPVRAYLRHKQRVLRNARAYAGFLREMAADTAAARAKVLELERQSAWEALDTHPATDVYNDSTLSTGQSDSLAPVNTLEPIPSAQELENTTPTTVP